MGLLRICNTAGDMEVPFTDTDYREAKKQFTKLLKEGRWAYRKEGAPGGEFLREFDPRAEEILIHPGLVGG